MNDFKFNCPKCGQHILANAAWIGRPVNCPSCDTRISIPAPEKPAKKKETAAIASTAKSKPSSTTVRRQPPAKTQKPTAATNGASRISTKSANVEKPANVGTGAVSTPEPEATKPAEQPRVAVLSPAIKLDIVRAVRQRIAAESGWLPGNVSGTTAYAAKMKERKLVLLDYRSPEASRFSLMGAFLLEMHLRQVIRTAAGRKKFLDEEIPEAIREVLLEQMSEDEGENAEDSLADQDLLSISHAQCLAALDVMKERYSQRVEQIRIEKAKRSLGNVRLADLVRQLEKKARVLPEDVATALYHELMDVRRRLDRLESRVVRDK